MSAARIHPTAVVHPKAELAHDVEVGPFCVIGPNVFVGAGTRMLGQCHVHGPTVLGSNNTVHPFAVLGGDPQHRDYTGSPSQLIIGDGNTFREGVTVHRGTSPESPTRVGSRGLFMVGVHVAHDAQIGDHVTLTNQTLVAGHVRIDGWAVAAGHVAIAPFVRVGESCFLAGNSMVERDVPPFLIAAGDRATLRGVNRVGLRRRGIPEESMMALKTAYRCWFRTPQRSESIADAMSSLPSDAWVQRLVRFLRESSKLGLAPTYRTGS